jgi:hypothetical protein
VPRTTERGSLLIARARDLRRLVHGRQPLGWDAERLGHLVGPAAGGDVEEEGARCVGGVDRVPPGESQAHVVLRQQDAPYARVDLGLVPA